MIIQGVEIDTYDRNWKQKKKHGFANQDQMKLPFFPMFFVFFLEVGCLLTRPPKLLGCPLFKPSGWNSEGVKLDGNNLVVY